MKPRIALLSCTALLLTPHAALADTLQQALRSAYQSNPTLTAQRANVRAADENVPIALAAGRPTLDGTVTYQENVLQGSQSSTAFFSDPDRQLVAQLNASIPLVTFGAVTHSVRAAEARVEASRLGLRGTEGDLFSSVVAAYMDVIRDEAAVRLNLRNRDVIQYTYNETRDRYQAGERGATDVSQAEARVALAISQLETAEARLISSRENYVRLVGNPPGALEPPPPLPEMPGAPDDAVAIALENNPTLAAARAAQAAAGHDVRVANTENLPRLNAIGGLNRYDYLGSLAANTGPRNRDQGTTGYVGVQLRLPFYQGGRVGAQIRQARERHGAAIEQTMEAERDVVAETRSSYATWRSAQRVTEAARGGVSANERALEGIRAETDVGLRPLLDLLNAEQELLNAQVTLVTAERDAYVAGFALLAAMGWAEARNLDLEGTVLYDPMLNYRSVRNRLADWSEGENPQTVATGTTTTPAQDAAVAMPPATQR